MYKVIIVDDEAFIRDKLINMIPWEEYGLQVIGSAEDGLEAVELVEKCEPDIVITDIRMPRMSGIELISQIIKAKKNIHFIILSGYGEFEYAKKAIKLGVSDYLLKPTQPDELFEALVKITDKIEQSKNNKEQFMRQQEYLAATSSQYIHELLLGNQPGTAWEEDASFVGLDWLLSNSIRLILINMDRVLLHQKRSKVEVSQFSIQNVVMESLATSPSTSLIRSRLGQWVLVLKDDLSNEELDEFSNNIYQNVQQYTKIPVFMMISPGLEYKQIGKIYWELEKSMEFYGQKANQPIKHLQVDQNELEYDQWIQPMSQLIQWINDGEADHIKRWLDSIEMTFLDWDLSTAQKWCADWLGTLQQQLGGENLGDQLQQDTDKTIRMQITSQPTVKDLLKYFTKQIYNLMKRRNHSKPHHLIKKALEIIHERFDGDIQLSIISEEINISTVYLSDLFKKETGKTFREYLMQLRMEKAAQILKDPTIKVYEVSYMIGYRKVEHFVKLFKKYYNMTPSEYRGAVV